MSKLSIELRNINFGPVTGGSFLKTQKEAAERFGIGDETFAIPANYSNDFRMQYGYEEITPVIDVHYRDGSKQTFSDHGRRGVFQNFTFNLPGQTSNVELALNKPSREIDFVRFELRASRYYHSGSGGCGLTAFPAVSLGSIFISRNPRTEGGCLRIKCSLTEYWDILPSGGSLEPFPTGYTDGPVDLVKLEEVMRPREIADTAWHKVELVQDWRSELTKHIKAYSEWSGIWVMPIASFEPGKPGVVVGINNGGDTTNQRAHIQLWRKYREEMEEKKKAADETLSTDFTPLKAARDQISASSAAGNTTTAIPVVPSQP